MVGSGSLALSFQVVDVFSKPWALTLHLLEVGAQPAKTLGKRGDSWDFNREIRRTNGAAVRAVSPIEKADGLQSHHLFSGLACVCLSVALESLGGIDLPLKALEFLSSRIGQPAKIREPIFFDERCGGRRPCQYGSERLDDLLGGSDGHVGPQYPNLLSFRDEALPAGQLVRL
jgi:hypothetical protein